MPTRQAPAPRCTTCRRVQGPGALSLLHITDTHAQLLPIAFVNRASTSASARSRAWPHRVGHELLRAAGIAPNTRLAHAITHLDFAAASRATASSAASRTWRRWCNAESQSARRAAARRRRQLAGLGHVAVDARADMVQAQLALGVDATTGHWEFTHGMARVKQVLDDDFKGRIAFVAQNVRTLDFDDQVFEPFVRREVNGVPVAVIGQAFPYTPIANPRYFVADWTFGIQEQRLQELVDRVRADGTPVVVLLSHNGMDVDLKLAARVRGIDVIFGGHTHDGVPLAVPVANAGGKTLVTNAGCNGKFLGVMDLRVADRRVADYRYRLLPVFADLLPPDPAMQALITRVRAPFADRLNEPLAVTDGLLYRRGNFNGSWDQLLCDALLEVQGAQIALSPGFRWGTSLLPGETITREMLMDQLAITYPNATLTEMTGAALKTVLEDVADNLFNPDPYYQQGGDMVRTGGLSYTLDPTAAMGARITELRLNGRPLDADKVYKVAGWASVSEGARSEAGNRPVWELVEAWLRQRGRVPVRRLNTPSLLGAAGNPGIAEARH
jgi:sulfur-oxidizing protein SoxB